MPDSPGLADSAAGLVVSVFCLPNGKQSSFSRGNANYMYKCTVRDYCVNLNFNFNQLIMLLCFRRLVYSVNDFWASIS